VWPALTRAVLLLTGGLLALNVSAAEPANDSTALRTALRDTMLQLRSAQSDLAALQAAQPALVEEKKELSDKYDALKKQMAADRAAAEKTLAALSAQNTEQKATIARLSDALEKTRAEGQKAAQAAQVAQEQVAKLAQEKIVLERSLADREGKNLALYVLGNEILTRYEEYSLGKTLLAKEPFVGLARTKLENQVQDYQDKLLDQRVKP
jgi:chromosome segregation ATPase